MHARHLACLAGLALLAVPAWPQVSLPGQILPRGGVIGDPVTGRVLDQVGDLGETLTRESSALAMSRIERLESLVRRNRDRIEFDADRQPARRGILLLLDPSVADLRMAQQNGFPVSGEEEIESLGLRVVRVSVPPGSGLGESERKLRALIPSTTVSADHLHFASGAAERSAQAGAVRSTEQISTAVGVIDGAPGPGLAVQSIKGFAAGAPHPSNHGSAVVSLLRNTGVKTLHVADVYGTDKAGGNALAIARAIGWLVGRGARVINVSLVGPRNPVLEQAIRKAQLRGVVVVAAVGNDGPAAPPTYPASYRDVVAVSAIDRRNRVLLEAGRALHLDYVAPGADIYGTNAKGRRVKLRGTSFASPLVAARTAAALDRSDSWRSRLDVEATDLGKRGPDPVFGRGLVCGSCRPRR